MARPDRDAKAGRTAPRPSRGSATLKPKVRAHFSSSGADDSNFRLPGSCSAEASCGVLRLARVALRVGYWIPRLDSPCGAGIWALGWSGRSGAARSAEVFPESPFLDQPRCCHFADGLHYARLRVGEQIVSPRNRFRRR